MKSYLISLLVLSSTFLMSERALSDQLENELAAEQGLAPQGILVKVNPQSKTIEIYKAPKLDKAIINKTASNDENVRAIEAVEIPANLVGDFKMIKNELDRDSSTEAWWGRWRWSGYRWNNWGGYYRPYYYNWYRPYSYYPGYYNYYNNYGYNYNYNYGYNYGYNNCNYGWYY